MSSCASERSSFDSSSMEVEWGRTKFTSLYLSCVKKLPANERTLAYGIFHVRNYREILSWNYSIFETSQLQLTNVSVCIKPPQTVFPVGSRSWITHSAQVPCCSATFLLFSSFALHFATEIHVSIFFFSQSRLESIMAAWISELSDTANE